MTVDSEHDREDELLTGLLPQLDQDAAPVDAAFLDRLRDRTAAEFVGTVAEPASVNEPAAADTVVISSGKERTMLTLTARLALSITVAAIGGVAWLAAWFGAGEAVGAVTLGDVLRQVVQSNTLQLKVVRDGAEANVWVRSSEKSQSEVRWEESPTLYQIASGSRLWEIDEEANTALAGSRTWFRPEGKQQQIDLLAMLGVDEHADRFRKVRSAGNVRHADRDCRVFRFTTKQDNVPLLIEAFADADTNELLTIAAWPDGVRQGKRVPLAELRLIARNKPVDEAKFIVAKSLSNDGRIGRVADSQGMVTLRPVMRSRWTPIARQMLIRPGDWLRTDVRGANAASIVTTSQFRVIAGPGSLVEIQKPGQILLHGGEVQVSGSENAEEDFTVLAPRDQKVVVKAGETGLYRLLADRTLRKIEKKPIWLAGFEGSSNEESIGSLICNIDGRNVPLTVGYHKVKVEIRDQIARTTIEESFVNRTETRLEGVFHFPLPQDASISGFGMWIGGELVEADVVEKQRAREIYETILRERRDPGLLEWAGGNIFKARVFPIEGHSEKRIKIVYTQVLPLRANQYRYSYALRSELLQKTPLRELSLDVLISSTLPIRSVKCPTDSVRSDKTEHSAHVEFAAQEYSPTRDFEVVCEVDAKQSDVVVVPHRRGDDGYFLAQITLPGGDGNWQRDVLPDGDPLDVMLVCDTSASMDSDSRKKQGELVAAILSALGPKDRFNLAVCDVDCHWLFPESVPAGEDHEKAIRKARQWLSDRTSLGWTDLDKAFASIKGRAGAGSHVIYIGDGIVTSGDADPQAFAQRLEGRGTRVEGDPATQDSRSSTLDPRPTFHAVSVGSGFESVVLKSIAGVGGGSVRAIGGERTPQTVAFELLNEIAQPGLTDVKLEFRGLQVAAVYPKRLPNLAAGTQQIIVGRYLPQGEDQSGEMIITGNRGGEAVRFAARVQLKDAESGNSFIPRLWSRAHMDQLLQQGSSQFIKDEVIALSEEFHIITPYTSLLVLETDADRERFGVVRRYEMRDGQRFFADGKDNANYELKQQQMKRAGDWRIGLRRSILRELAQLGRGTPQMQTLQRLINQASGPGEIERLGQLGLMDGSVSMISRITSRSTRDFRTVTATAATSSLGSYAGMGGGGSGFEIGGRFAGDRFGFSKALDDLNESDDKFSERDSESAEDWGQPLAERDQLMASAYDASDLLFDEAKESIAFQGNFRTVAAAKSEASPPSLFAPLAGRKKRALRQLGLPVLEAIQPFGSLFKANRGRANKPGSYYGSNGYYDGRAYVNWVSQLFPELPETPAPMKAARESDWPADAVAVSNSLLQKDALAALNVALETRRRSESFDVRWGNRKTSENTSVELFSKNRWLKTSASVGSQSLIHWCDEKDRGVLSKGFLLGRVRDSKPEELKATPMAAAPYSQSALHESLRGYDVEVQKQGDHTILLLSIKQQPTSQIRYTIDTGRHVVLSVEHLASGEVTSRTVYGTYKKVAGLWWPLGRESFDAQGRKTSVTSYSVDVVAAEPFAKRFDEELALRAKSQLMQEPLPSIRDAEVAAGDGSAGFEDRLVLLLQSSWIQMWDEVLKQLEFLEKLAPEKAGLRWVRASVLKAARRNEDVRQLMLARSKELLAGRPDEFFLAKFMLNQASQLAAQNEQLAILDQLRPVFERQPAHALASRDWQTRRIAILRQLGKNEEYIPMQRTLAEDAPWDVNAQGQYARDLAVFGDYDGAYRWLRQELDRDAERTEYEVNQLRRVYADLLNTQGKMDALVEFLREPVDEGSENQQLYLEYLTALVLADRVADANELVGKWLKAGRVEGKLEGAELARFSSALSFALGQQHNRSLSYIAPEWLKPLEETGRYFLRHEHHFAFAKRILDWYYFKQTDEYDQLIVEVAAIVKADADKLPVDVATSMVNWSLVPAKLGNDEWGAISDTLLTRWNAADNSDERHSFGSILVSIFRIKFANERLLPFMRQRVAHAEETNEAEFAANFSRQLFDELLTRGWSEEVEIEAFGLLERVSAAEPGITRVTSHVETLHRLVDAMLKARFAASNRKLQDEGHPEELTQTELAAKQIEFRKAALTGLAERLAEAMKKRPLVEGADAADTSSILGDWLKIERMYLEVTLGRNLEEVAADCWTILEDSPPAPLTGDQLEALEADEVKRIVLEDMLRGRALTTLSNLAVRRAAPKGLADRVLKYIDTAIEQEQSAADAQSGDDAFDWKQIKYGLLVALDRPDELEVELRKWIGSDEYVTPWQMSLAKLLAERARIDEAIPLFEAVERKTPLSASDYQMLADWYLVSDRRADYERAKIDAYKVAPENQVGNWIRQRMYRWQRTDGEIPSELDEGVLFAFQALFKQAGNPESYVYLLRDVYRACRDFRLLKMIPDAVIGRTPQQVYAVLKNLHSYVLGELRDEAAADEIIARIKTLQGTAESAIDRRALDLLESMIERKSSEILNEPGPHSDAAIAALKRAFKRDWADGEQRQMADFLDALGTIKQPELAAEQMRQLKELHRLAEPGTDDRFHIAYSLAHGHYSSYGRQEEGIAIMENAIREFDQTHSESWQIISSAPLDGYVKFLEGVSRFSQAEKLLDGYLAKDISEGQTNWLLNRQNQVLHEALDHDGRVSLGAGDTLYQALVLRLVEQARVMDAHYQYAILSRLIGVFRSANNKHLPSANTDVRKFAFKLLPPLLERQTHQYTTVVDQVGRLMRDISGPRYGVEFLMDRVEDWPVRFQHTYQSGWSRCGHNMARWWQETGGKAPDLEPRLLKIVLKELRRELTTRQRRSPNFYWKYYSYYWAAKEQDYARVADEVLQERSDSPRSVNFISEYLWNGLQHYNRAIEVRLVAHGKGLLAPEDLYLLTSWLHQRKRWAEAIPIMEPLVKNSPDMMKYRTALLLSYGLSSRPEQRDRLLSETDEHFRSGGRWTESNIAVLAAACVNVELDEAAVKYYGELIPLAQRSRPNRGIGEGTVSNYYRLVSQAHARLGNTREAVDAASGAIIAWGPRHERRSDAVSQMKSAIAQASDLDGYVEFLDDQLAETGQDSPLIRRMIGEVYAGKGNHEAAVAQLQLSEELQPFDQETHAALIKSYDALKDGKSASSQILKQLDYDRHNLALYKDLARRLKSDEGQSERAVTTIVEAAPKEAEHHEALAVIRQEQNRWSDAIDHWQHVASLRSLEPNGLLKLAEAQIHEKRWSAARTTVGKLKAKSWPSRFSNVESQTAGLERRIKAD